MDYKELQEMADFLTQEEDNREAEISKVADSISKIETLSQSEMDYIKAKLSGNIRSEKQYDTLTVIELKGNQFGVKRNGKFIVPFGKYGWIEGFESGLSRVRTYGNIGYTKNIIGVFDDDWNLVTDRKIIEEREAENRKKHPESYAKWGIIDENGNEVLPTEYDEIWKFLGKKRLSTKVFKDGVEEEIFFHDLNPLIPMPISHNSPSRYNDCDDDYFRISDCYDYEGNFDNDRLEDAILDGEYVPEDW